LKRKHDIEEAQRKKRNTRKRKYESITKNDGKIEKNTFAISVGNGVIKE